MRRGNLAFELFTVNVLCVLRGTKVKYLTLSKTLFLPGLPRIVIQP